MHSHAERKEQEKRRLKPSPLKKAALGAKANNSLFSVSFLFQPNCHLLGKVGKNTVRTGAFKA